MANMIPISTVTVGSGGASAIGFTNIPSTYTDLVVKLSGRSDRANKQAILSMAFNASSSSYTNKFLEGDGSTAVSGFCSGFHNDSKHIL
jgi:hypothetical protein